MDDQLANALLDFHALDHRQVLRWVAINRPAVFLSAIEVTNPANPYAWGHHLKGMLWEGPDNSPRKVAVIKFIREKTNLGLFEAKQVLDELYDRSATQPIRHDAQAVLDGLASVGVTGPL